MRRFVLALALVAGAAPAALALPAATPSPAGDGLQPAGWQRSCQMVPTPYGPQQRCSRVWVEPRRFDDGDRGWRRRHRDWDDRGDRGRGYDDRGGRGRGYDDRGGNWR